jgi:hypothetical protein
MPIMREFTTQNPVGKFNFFTLDVQELKGLPNLS